MARCEVMAPNERKWTTMPTTTLPSSQDENYDLSILENRAPSLGHLFRDRVAESGPEIAFWYPQGDDYAKVTWDQCKETVYGVAAGLIELGVQPEDRVALASGTRYEWVVADLATMCAGAATVTIYPSTIADDVAYIAHDSNTVVIVAEDAEQVEKLKGIRELLPEVRKVVVLEGEGDGDWVLSRAELQELGRKRLEAEPGCVDERIDALTQDRLATIIYTSGTTGRPKGVRLLHRSWTYQGAAVQSAGLLSKDDLQYLWLPLAHVFGKQLLTLPLQVGFPTVVDGRIDMLIDNLPKVRPTIMAAVPRIFEKVHGRIVLMMAQDGGAKEKLFHWANAVGGKVVDLRQQGKQPSRLLQAQHRLADKLVLGKVRDRFGGRVRFFISGSAGLDPEVNRWFNGNGLLILEGYGLTESSSAALVNRPHAHLIGSVGWPLPGLEVKVADDGEVLLRGDGIMDGYHNNPQATAEVLDADGWFHTGDIGELDERGFLAITDRKKDLFKTSTGKYVAPSQVEARFKGLCPYVGQFVVQGADRKFVSALVTLDPEAITDWAKQNDLGDKSYAGIVSSDAAREMVQGYIDQLNSGLNKWEQVKRFEILDNDLSVDRGELTPSLKVRRKVVSEQYKKEIDALYA